MSKSIASRVASLQSETTWLEARLRESPSARESSEFHDRMEAAAREAAILGQAATDKAALAPVLDKLAKILREEQWISTVHLRCSMLSALMVLMSWLAANVASAPLEDVQLAMVAALDLLPTAGIRNNIADSDMQSLKGRLGVIGTALTRRTLAEIAK